MKLTKEQIKALKRPPANLDELGDKPRRLFHGPAIRITVYPKPHDLPSCYSVVR